MLAFFENSWVFWWFLAIVAVLRWFHLFTAQGDHDVAEPVVRPSNPGSAVHSKLSC